MALGLETHTTLPVSWTEPLYTVLHNDGVIAKTEPTLQTGRACQLQSKPGKHVVGVRLKGLKWSQRIYIRCWTSCTWTNVALNARAVVDSITLIKLCWKGIPKWDGHQEECELHVVSSGPQKQILLLVTGSSASIGRDQVTFCIYDFETTDCFVEQ